MSAPKLHNAMWPGLLKTKPKDDPPALLGTSKDRGLIRPDDMREKIQSLYNRCKHAVEKRGLCKRENEASLTNSNGRFRVYLVRHLRELSKRL